MILAPILTWTCGQQRSPLTALPMSVKIHLDFLPTDNFVISHLIVLEIVPLELLMMLAILTPSSWKISKVRSALMCCFSVLIGNHTSLIRSEVECHGMIDVNRLIFLS